MQTILKEALAAYQAKSIAKKTGEQNAIMANATQALIDANIEAQALKVGDTIPEFSLPNVKGASVDSSELLKQGPLVISFYRGGWCPYCNMELRALQQLLPEFEQAGAQLVAISPQTPDNSLNTQEKNELAFEVLSDVGNQITRKFGLVFTMPIDLQNLYSDFGLDVAKHNGDSTFELPMPATYVVDKNGVIQYAFVPADYTKRAEPSDVLAAVKTTEVSV
ncbi:alkyl hydroperoxide reductase [marine bacterium AO1-C]|nr:alkyl hydroperoxide reductase [marine bacterium AO1-C]